MIEDNKHKPVSPYVQLSYVLPKSSLYLLPQKINNKLLEIYAELYEDNCKIYWAFCAYLWEGHVDQHHVCLKDLELLIQSCG